MSNASINCRCNENFLTTMAVDKDFAVSGAKMGLGISEGVLIYLLIMLGESITTTQKKIQSSFSCKNIKCKYT